MPDRLLSYNAQTDNKYNDEDIATIVENLLAAKNELDRTFGKSIGDLDDLEPPSRIQKWPLERNDSGVGKLHYNGQCFILRRNFR